MAGSRPYEGFFVDAQLRAQPRSLAWNWLTWRPPGCCWSMARDLLPSSRTYWEVRALTAWGVVGSAINFNCTAAAAPAFC